MKITTIVAALALPLIAVSCKEAEKAASATKDAAATAADATKEFQASVMHLLSS